MFPHEIFIYLLNFFSGVEQLNLELCLNELLACKPYYKRFIQEADTDTEIRVKRGEHMWWPYWSRKKYYDIRLASRCTDFGLYTIMKTEHIEKMIHFAVSDVHTTEEATRRVIQLLEDGKIDIYDSSMKDLSYYIRLCTHTKYTRSKEVKGNLNEILYD